MVFRNGAGLGTAAADALSAWTDALGAEFVVSDPEALQRAATATFATSSAVAVILRPGDRDQVQHAVRIANRFGVPLYPVSSGRNWGYGSRVPVHDGALLDLSRLNRIVDFDEELAYVTVEAGVTQRQLYEFLQARGSRLWMDATGSSAECSIVGNTMERGFGHTPMGDHCSTACGFEVVLPSGDCVETGFARFPGTRSAALSRWGLGPALDGLFSQSNFGIVTRMSVWLMPAPEYVQAFFFQTGYGAGPAIDALRPLRQEGTIRSVMHIGNDYKVLSGTGMYPWDETRGRTPLDLEAMRALRRRFQIGRWNGSGALYGTRAQVRDSARRLRAALAGKVDRLRFIDDGTLRMLERLEKPYRLVTGRTDMQRALTLLPPLLDVMKGIPTDQFLPSVYWRKKMPVPPVSDPDRDRCGVLWCSPVAPFRGSDVEEMTDVAERMVLGAGFEPLISISLVSERATISTIAITYDREVAGEDERAERCYDAVIRALLDRGYPPYRLNVCSMEYASTGGAYEAALLSIKTSLDPNGILAPGRYLPNQVRTQ